MSKRNETRYDEDFAMLRQGASDEEIRIRLGFSRAVLDAMRKDLMRQEGPDFWKISSRTWLPVLGVFVHRPESTSSRRTGVPACYGM